MWKWANSAGLINERITQALKLGVVGTGSTFNHNKVRSHNNTFKELFSLLLLVFYSFPH